MLQQIAMTDVADVASSATRSACPVAGQHDGAGGTGSNADSNSSKIEAF